MGDGGERTRVVVAGIGGRGVWTANKLRADARYEIVALCDRNRSGDEKRRVEMSEFGII